MLQLNRFNRTLETLDTTSEHVGTEVTAAAEAVRRAAEDVDLAVLLACTAIILAVGVYVWVTLEGKP
jgi:hypothetical protein